MPQTSNLQLTYSSMMSKTAVEKKIYYRSSLRGCDVLWGACPPSPSLVTSLMIMLHVYLDVCVAVSSDSVFYIYLRCVVLVPCRQPTHAPDVYYPDRDTIRLYWKVSTT